jgi:hypothetical protein
MMLFCSSDVLVACQYQLRNRGHQPFEQADADPHGLAGQGRFTGVGSDIDRWGCSRKSAWNSILSDAFRHAGR